MENFNRDIFEIREQTLELVIKAGRRLMHDFKHLLDEMPNDYKGKQTYRERAEMWEDIFYPDNGPKNYRSSMHLRIMDLERDNARLIKLLEDNGLDPNLYLPF